MKLPKGYHLTPDGSVLDNNDDVVFFSIERFKIDICQGNCCFICGTSPDSANFNDEHVIPEWVLRRANLFSRFITLPNGIKYRYDKYKVPCCVRCNSFLGENVEKPISKIMTGGVSSIAEHFQKNGSWLVFAWLALLFLKTHLKDKEFRKHLDARKGSTDIADAYEWEELYFVHCIARSVFAKPELGPEVMGSIFVLPASLNGKFEHFDYGDLYHHKAVFFRFGEAALVGILNDSCACLSLEANRLLPRIKGPLSPIQLREVMARLAYLNMLIEDRPRFHTEFNGQSYRISVTRSDKAVAAKGNDKSYGEVLWQACADLLANCINPDIETIKEHVRNGRYTFLFDEHGEFIKEQMVFDFTSEST